MKRPHSNHSKNNLITRNTRSSSRNSSKIICIENFENFNRSDFLSIDHETNRIEHKHVNEFSMIYKLRRVKQLFDKRKLSILQKFLTKVKENFLCSYENLENFYLCSYR